MFLMKCCTQIENTIFEILSCVDIDSDKRLVVPYRFNVGVTAICTSLNYSCKYIVYCITNN
jgi:hypothetical protein